MRLIQKRLFVLLSVVMGLLAAATLWSDMSYATLEDVIARVGYNDLAEAAAPDNSVVDGAVLKQAVAGDDLSAYSRVDQTATTDAVARIERVLEEASAEVDGYLSAQLPFSEVPAIIKVKTLDIAVWRLFGGDSDSENSRNYQEALRYLRGVSEGRIALQVTAGEQTDTVQVAAPDREFTEARLRSFTGRC